ncbi:ABC transporter ATP-binding protein [Candidatus Jorgensenbacteria bacterium]|nr:ABC transporter ATP-binding protein [Candidatus Jorgensenbacteria bacterium]
MRQLIKRIIEIYRPFRKAVIALFSFLVVLQILSLFVPYVFGKIIDAIILKDFTLFKQLAFLSFCLYFLQNIIVGYLRDLVETKHIDFDVPRYVASLTLGKLLNFSIGQHLNQNSGITQSVVGKGEASLRRFGQTVVYEVIPLIVEGLLTVFALLYLNLVLGSIVISCLLLYIGFTVYVNLKFKDDMARLEKMGHQIGKQHTEILRNLELIQINAQEERTKAEYDMVVEIRDNFGKQLWTRFSRYVYIRNVIIGITSLTVMLVGVELIKTGSWTTGSLVTFIGWSSALLGRLVMFGRLHRTLMELSVAIKNYLVLIDTPPDVCEVDQPVCLDNCRGEIVFDGVSFNYPNRSWINEGEAETVKNVKGHAIQDMNFTVRAGEKIALVGHSGAGKSTIVALLLRAFDPDRGSIYIDGHNLKEVDLESYRSAIGFVEQDIQLFDDSIRYNVTFGLNGRGKEVDDETLLGVARAARLSGFIDSLELGFDTMIGERGVKLSGGERQRLAIARALIKEPQILIFDEATSNLDAENEMMIRESIERASEGRTTIIIAHRLSTVRNVDRIFVLDGGRIVGEGSHDDLVGSCNVYQRLIKNQVVAI